MLRNLVLFFVAVLMIVVPKSAQGGPAGAGESAAPAAPMKVSASPGPAAAAEPIGFSPVFIDTSVSPCQNFYQFACGKWLQKNPVPPEYATWSRFNELADRNREELRKILEKAAASPAGKSELQRKIGDYYASCMDEKLALGEGAKPIEAALGRIAKLSDARGVVLEAGELRRSGVPALFAFASAQDARDAREVIAEADQSGLGLPDRDYYTNEDDKSKELRKQYGEHMVKMFQLAGDSADAAAGEARRVMGIETALARGSMTKVDRRDPEKLYNRKSLDELGKLAPAVPWQAYFEAAGLGPVASINVASPGYFGALQLQLETASLQDWKSYLRWTLLRAEAPRLSPSFVDESFRFYGATLTGAKVLQPRWKRCVNATDQGLRDLLGQPYVEATFGADGKKRMLEMVAALSAAMDADLDKVAWMDDETRVLAKAKLQTIVNKIGYPDKWVDYGKLQVERGGWSANAARASRFGFARDMAKVGKPLDRNEWGMTPPTVNAYYNPQMNEIAFPAGILQPPFFDKKLDDAPNYGGIGGVIGHEISHGFDDEGSQFDKDGNLENWWSEKSAAEFKRRAGCVEKQFSEYSGIDELKVNGKLTLGENIGDLGGLRIAYAALKKTNGAKLAEKIDGFTGDQRFFLGWGQVWCRNATPEAQRLQLLTDPHSPAMYRVNGPLANLPEFRSAFQCPVEAAMVRAAESACEVW